MKIEKDRPISVTQFLRMRQDLQPRAFRIFATAHPLKAAAVEAELVDLIQRAPADARLGLARSDISAIWCMTLPPDGGKDAPLATAEEWEKRMRSAFAVAREYQEGPRLTLLRRLYAHHMPNIGGDDV